MFSVLGKLWAFKSGTRVRRGWDPPPISPSDYAPVHFVIMHLYLQGAPKCCKILEVCLTTLGHYAFKTFALNKVA